MTIIKKLSINKNLCLCGCGQTCKNKWKRGHNNKGSNNHFWKRGYLINKKGYKKISIGKKLSKFEHRIVYEEYYNCCLLPYTILHHIDGNILNNKIENLYPCYRGQHNKIEKTGKKRYYTKEGYQYYY